MTSSDEAEIMEFDDVWIKVPITVYTWIVMILYSSLLSCYTPQSWPHPRNEINLSLYYNPSEKNLSIEWIRRLVRSSPLRLYSYFLVIGIRWIFYI